jgi:hypothetical protein
MIYVAVMALLVLINLTSNHGRDEWWVQWPAIGWGFAVAIHGLLAYFGVGVFGSDWEERRIAEVMRQKKPL